MILYLHLKKKDIKMNLTKKNRDKSLLCVQQFVSIKNQKYHKKIYR